MYQPDPTGSRRAAPSGDESLPAAALALAVAGIEIFPLLPRSKRPRFDGSFHNATTNTATIAEHWKAFPRDNIGIRPGGGMGVVDVDPRHEGDLALSLLEQENGPLPATWTAKTGSGGWHHWFIFGDTNLRAKLCTGVDLKTGRTGYVVAPPSIHPDGGLYAWENYPEGWPAPAPEWLRKQAARPAALQPGVRTPRAGGSGNGPFSAQCLAARVGKAAMGERNRILYGAAKDAAKQGDLDAFEADLVAAAALVGLDSREIDATIASARRSAA